MTVEMDIFDDAIKTIKDLAKFESIDLVYQDQNAQTWWLILDGNYYDLGVTGTDMEKVNDTLWEMINGYEVISGKAV